MSKAHLVPPLSDWYQPEALNKPPRDFGARLVKQPPRCVDTASAIFPPCQGDNCPLQHYLITHAGHDAKKAMQELNRMKHGLSIAQGNIKQVPKLSPNS